MKFSGDLEMIDHYSTELKDKLGRKFKVGDKIVRGIKMGSRAVTLQISEVTNLTEDKMYLDDSHVAIVYPGRLMIVTSIIEGLL